MAIPADTLKNRTFIGLLIAQFLAAFNDQAIHASAMFFAINHKALTEKAAITLMPILFFAPWAIFVTLAGYFADRYSKQKSLIFWKFVEIAIMLVATLGFWLGDVHQSKIGPWIVLSCVFLMGMHSAFFVPAKYGAMPEILQPQLLSRGNGILESLSFLAVILGTVSGGLLSDYFDDTSREYYIGIILLVLAIIGSLASLLIEPIPPANAHRPFPKYIYGPLYQSLRTLVNSQPLRLAMIGIAFFTFMVAFMRATVYMLGESQYPRWSETKTSLIVGATSLGIGLGAPLAGMLSGRKVELGLVPFGAFGMAISCALAALLMNHLIGLVLAIVAIGFFTGFYLVPLFTLQQHRAPKSSKGDVVAANNFVNVIGAILASVVFFGVVSMFQKLGLTTVVVPNDRVAVGKLMTMETKAGRPLSFQIDGEKPLRVGTDSTASIEFSKGIPAQIDPGEEPSVIASQFKAHGVEHIQVRLAEEPLQEIYDRSNLPKYLFCGAGVMSLLTLGLLRRQMPDLLQRMVWAFQSLGQSRMHVVGTGNLPSVGPVIFATNCRDAEQFHAVISATDRRIEFVDGKLSESDMERICRLVKGGTVVALSASATEFLPALQHRLEATCLPVYYGPSEEKTGSGVLRVAFGSPLPANASGSDVQTAITAAAGLSDHEAVH